MVILKSVITCVALFLAYQTWIDWARPVGNHTLRGLHDMIFIDGNIIRAQRFLHGQHDQKIIFVGSSITQIMEPFLNQPDVACLGLPGLGSSDGLDLIEHSGARPKLIMIEINLLQREPSPELLKEAMEPHLFWFHEKFSASRHEFQPANLIVPRIEAGLRKESLKGPQAKPARPLPPEHKHDEEGGTGRLDAIEPDVASAIERLPQVKLQIDRMGAAVAFYQLPEDPKVSHSSAMGRLRKEVETCFGQPVFFDAGQNYCVPDGMHMYEEDASAYAHLLLQYARQRLPR